MGLFERYTILFVGSNQYIYHGYQQSLRNSKIKFKAYATDKQLQNGCCGLNSSNGPKKTSCTYTIMVKEKDADAAKKLIRQFAAEKGISEESNPSMAR